MKHLTYVSDNGYTIQFNSNPFYISESDLNSASANFERYKPSKYDGEITECGTYNGKPITIAGKIVGKSKKDLESNKNILALAMNIHQSGWLYSESHAGTTQKIRVTPSHNPDYGKDFGVSCSYSCEWFADTPYWTATNEKIVQLGSIQALWSFPFCAPVYFGNTVGRSVITNPTGYTIEPIIEIMSQLQIVKIANLTTGETLELDIGVESDEKLIIDCQNCEIQKVDLTTGQITDATNYLVAGKEFLTIVPGKNTFELQNAITTGQAFCYIKYNEPKGAV